MNPTRHQQLLSLIKRSISAELLELNHELFHAVAVTDVLLSNDGSEARIWVDADAALIDQLNTKYRGELQYRFMKSYPRKHVPKLTFIKDTGEATHMDELLATLEKEDAEDA